MNFADAMRNNAKITYTENGMKALNTTSDARLDLFSVIGALRGQDDNRITRLVSESYKVDPVFTAKIVFYGRDIRGGLGERETFRTILKYLAVYHKEAIIPNLDLIGVYGRYDDLYCLVGTPVEKDMWGAMKRQYEEDMDNLSKGNSVSLLGKWMKSVDSSSKESMRLGILTAKNLGLSVYDYKRNVRKLRKQIGIVESLMSSNRWSEIKYSEVPSRAMMIYRNAFVKHDGVRYDEFINGAITGDVKINSSTLYPYDLIEKVFNQGSYSSSFRFKEDKTIEAQWRQLPDYVEKGTNAIVIADTSGSMHGRPIYTALGLAVYFAERNTGSYHNMFMSFSNRSTIQVLKGDTLAQKLNSINYRDWQMSTNVESAFNKILEIGVKNHVSVDEMPKSIVIISDMEFNACDGSYNWGFYDAMEEKFAENGYIIPNVIFWNVNSRHDTYHADRDRKGVQLVSGQSASTFKSVMGCIGMTPVEAMEKIINSDRYSAITVG